MELNSTDNAILFDCEEDLLLGTTKYSENISEYLRDYELHKGIEVNNNFSHDNWKGVACWLEVNRPYDLKRVPIFGRHTWRPDNLALFIWIRYRRLGLLVLPLYQIFQFIDAIRMRKDREGVPHTSGLLLNYFVMRTFKMNWIFKFVNWRVGKTFKHGWYDVFKRYFVQEDNVRVLEAFKTIKGAFKWS